jgi:two-component system, OmpR family, alkaline phosphatase synthesis response regulator PhoP
MATILWVEDEAVQIGGLVRPLKNDKHNIIVALDKKDALQKLKNNEPDLIILDLIIPAGIDNPQKRTIEPYEGMLFLEEAKRISPNVPVIVLTIVSDQEVLDSVRKLGADKILRKGSYLPSDLRKEVYALLGLAM